MTRFRPEDVQVAAAADEFIAAAVKQLAGRAAAAGSRLSTLDPAADPQSVLEAVQIWLRAQIRFRESVDEILALLIMRGASRRGLADALGVRPSTIAARTAGHPAVRATRRDLTLDTTGRWKWAD